MERFKERFNHTKNYTEIQGSNFLLLQSYKSFVVKLSSDGEIDLGEDWEYSPTTVSHVNYFLKKYGSKETAKTLRKKISNGEITVKKHLI